MSLRIEFDELHSLIRQKLRLVELEALKYCNGTEDPQFTYSAGLMEKLSSINKSLVDAELDIEWLEKHGKTN